MNDVHPKLLVQLVRVQAIIQFEGQLIEQVTQLVDVALFHKLLYLGPVLANLCGEGSVCLSFYWIFVVDLLLLLGLLPVFMDDTFINEWLKLLTSVYERHS